MLTLYNISPNTQKHVISHYDQGFAVTLTFLGMGWEDVN